MHKHFRQELIRVALVAAGVVLLGWISGAWVLALLVGLGGYLLWQLRQLWLFEEWLLGVKRNRQRLRGVWREAADRIDRIRQRARQRKKRLGRLLHRFHDTLETLPDAAVILDGEYQILWFNSAARRLLGLTPGHRGHNPRLTRLLAGKGLRRWLADGIPDVPLQVTMEGPPRQELELRLLPFGDGQFLLTAHDITELQRVQAMRRDFIANVSHELRTPLTVVLGHLEMLAEDPEVPPDSRAALGASLRQARRMERLVADLLLLSRLESEEQPLAEEPVAVPALLRQLVEDARRLDPDRRPFDCRIDETLGVRGSESELTSAFGNLIFNAVIHTPPGTPVTIRWQAERGQPVFEVIDAGPGIAAEHLERLTERFYRVDKGRSRARGGTGLGLAIVRHVLRRHQARLEIDSQPGQGSRFGCRFPAARALRLAAADE